MENPLDCVSTAGIYFSYAISIRIAVWHVRYVIIIRLESLIKVYAMKMMQMSLDGKQVQYCQSCGTMFVDHYELSGFESYMCRDCTAGMMKRAFNEAKAIERLREKGHNVKAP